MAASAVKVLVVDGKEITQSVDLRTTKQGSATKVKAIKGGKFILADTDTGAAPENITAHRVGNNLHVSLQGTGYDDPELIIEDFYSQDGQGELVGVAEDGAYYQYIASDAEAAHEAGTLGDNVASPLVLGSQQLVGFGAGLVPAAGLSWLGLGLFGLGALGLIGAALADNGGNSSIGGGNPGDGGGGNPGDGGGNPGNPGEGDNGGIKPNTPNIGEIDDNVQPHTGPIPDGGVTNDSHPVLIGTGDPGDIVTIIDNGKPLGTATVDDTGKWTFKPETPLDEGEHEIVVIGTDPDGQESDPSPPKTIIVDTTPPAAPVIDGADDNVGVTGPIGNGDTTDDAQPVLHGTAEANSVVAIYDGATLLGSAQVDGDGNWSFQPPTPLFIGEHHFTAVATDAAGNSSVPSNEFDLSLLVGGAPSAPAITGVIDHVEPNVGPVQENGFTNDAEPTIQGTAKAGSIVIVYDTDGTVIGSATSDATGHWEVTPTTPLADGLHNITATATEGGVVSAPTAVYPINVDTSIPAAPVIDDSSLIDHVGAITGPIQDGGTTDDSEPEFKGTALPNAIVTIYDGDQIIGSTTSDADGNWDFYPSTPLSDGPHVFSATATNAAGGTSVPSAPINFIVDTSGVAIAITGVIDNEGPITGPISRDDGVTDDPRPQIVGTATANSLVMVYDNGELIGSTTSDALGRWTLTPEADLPEGANAITATSTNPATGVVSDPTAPFNFTIDTHIPAAPVIEGADDNVGAITGPIGNNGHTDDSTPTLHGTAEANSIVTIYDGALMLGTALADADGSWSFTPTTPLVDGPHDFTATSTDAAGKTGPVSNDWAVNIDTGIPLAPTIGEIDDNVEPHTGPIPDGGVTNDNQPVLVGTGTPGDVVTIIDNGTPLGTATVGDDGNWTFKPETPLDDGDHDFTVIETNPVGSVSDPSPPKTIVVDTTAPAAPVIDGADDNVGVTGPIGNGDTTDDAQPVLHGTAEANSVVAIYDGATLLGSAQVDGDGNWSFQPPTPLFIGEHHFTAVATDAAGNSSVPSNEFDLSLLVGGAPSAPAITGVIDHVEPNVGPVQENGFTNDAEPTIQGTAKAGSIVIVYDTDGTVIGSATSDATGHWEVTPTTPLADGLHNITATATEGGVVSAPTAVYPINVDTSIPAAPVIDDSSLIDHVGAITGPIQDGGTTDDSEPEFKGTALPNAIVTIYDGDQIIGSTTSDADGNWDFYPSTPLSDGPHVFSATATNAAGGTSVPSAPINFIVDTSGVAIAITGVIDNEGPITGPISRDDGVTDDPRPQIVGTATANSLVMVYDNGELIGSTTSDALGRWTLTPEADLPEGANAITATSTNPATGVVSDPTAPFNFTIDTHIPAAPVIEGADDNVGAITGPIGNNGHTDDSTPTLHGTAEANSIVTIYDGALMLGTALADADGSWSFTPTTPLVDGPHDFTATSTDAAGKTGPVSNDWAVNIDTGIPLAPTIGEIDDNVEPHTGPIPDGGLTNDNQPVLVGTGTPGDVVTIIDNGTPLGTATVGDDGNWTFKPETPLDDGDHDFTVIETNPVGSVSDPSPPKTIVVDTTAPVAPVIDGADDNFGAITGPIGNNGHTDDTTPTLHGTAEANSIVTIYDGALVLGSVQAGADGGWRFTPTTPLANGAHDFTAIATDAAGNPSAVSNDWAVNIDTSVPLAPTISEIDDNVEPHTGPIPEGEVTNDNRPVLVGTGTAGDIVTIRDNGTVLGTATVGAAGTWTFRPTAPLADGNHAFTATETNSVGTVSAPSLPHAIVVDTTAPPAPVITVVDDSAGAPIGTGDDTTELRPVVHGTAEPNSIVTIYDGTTLLGSAPVDGNGNWVFPTTADLALGLHNLTAVATDPAGNPGGASNPYGFDIIAPAVPWISSPNEQFSGEPLGTVIGAAPYVTSNSGLTISGDATIISQTGANNPIFFKLRLDGTTSFTLAAGYAGNTLSFSVINPLWPAHGTTIALYNPAGDLIGRATIPAGTGQGIQYLNFQAPAGQLVASFVIENPTPTFAIDSIFTSTDWDLAADWASAKPTPVSTTIEVGTGVTAFEAPVEPDADDQAAQAAGVDEQLNTDQADADKADADKAGDDALQASASDEVAGIQSPEASSFVLQEDVQVHVEQAGNAPVLVLEGANQVLDLSALTEAEQAQVGDAKIIDITGTGDNTLNLSLADVLEQGGKSLFIDDGKTQMMVKGDAGDVVNLDDLLEGVNAEGDWTQAADAVTVEGVAYNVYQHSNLDAELLVQQGVTTNLS